MCGEHYVCTRAVSRVRPEKKAHAYQARAGLLYVVLFSYKSLGLLVYHTSIMVQDVSPEGTVGGGLRAGVNIGGHTEPPGRICGQGIVASHVGCVRVFVRHVCFML